MPHMKSVKIAAAGLFALLVCVFLASCSDGKSADMKEYEGNAAVTYYTEGQVFDDLLTMARAEGDISKVKEVGIGMAAKMGELRDVQPPESCIETQIDLLSASNVISEAGICYLECAKLYQSANVELDVSSITEYTSQLKIAGECQDEAINLIKQAKDKLA